MFHDLKTNRRNFLKTSLIASAGAAIGVTPAKANARGLLEPQNGLPTVQLYTDETSAQFRVLVNPQEPVIYQILSSDGRQPKIDAVTLTQNPYDATTGIEHLLVTGLELKNTYTLKIFDRKTGTLRDERIFRALNTRNPNGRFALVSCMLDLLLPIQSYMWQAMEDAKPDVIFIIGDTAYTDVGGDGSVANNWARHINSRNAIDLYFFKNLVPVIATWDDHDYAGNNADKHHPLNGHSIKVFQAMFGWTPVGAAKLGPGVASYVEFFGQRFFLMDDRTWRDPWNTPQGLHWGNDQENWLLKSLTTDTRPAWLLNGSQYFGAYLEKDSFEGRHPYQFKRFIKSLQSIEASVLFGSGDVHFSELMRIEKSALGYETFEITSSSMHSMTSPWNGSLKTNPRRLLTTWHYNFVLAQGNATTPGQFKFKTTSVGKDLRVYFDKVSTITRTAKDLVR